MSFTTLAFEPRGHVRLIGLARPAKRNAFTTTMLRELAEAYTAFEDDSDARVALLWAQGDHFTGGLDLAEVGPRVASAASLFPDGLVDPLGLGPRRATKPVVCVVQGTCLTIGIELMLASDVTIAAAGARFAQMEVRRGIMPFGGATLRFAAVAGWPRAMKHLLTGDEFDAAEALAMGLVAEVVPDGAQLERGLALAERIAQRAPLAVQATLASARLARDRGPEAALAELMPRARALFSTADAAEGVRSFLERREGRFEGR
ncbi:MAG: crotonase/enoyl-CoA hydratase family protein [Deltaproteobacteria bacterium]|nr:crotonase/enoyl-CoA hydratase family protein [Deltaproteobacteria bacterium]